MYKLGINENFQTNEQFGGSLNGELADCEFAEILSELNETINCISRLLGEYSDTSSDEGSFWAGDDNFDTTSDVKDNANLLLNADIVNFIQQAANVTYLSRNLQDINSEIIGSQSANDLMPLKNALCLLSTENSPHSEEILMYFVI